ncbi:16S rRNA (guanine(966)-N(2))-methyltransferase RsmD [Marinimicrobium agarilyticum]|uniref:16S rRNA (guanine(966)-N(2))-methyltransferase RsmD n=1 Tax=Marinimicrobium agarilyticum TaxID=306546 RepID=UPI00048680FC|nr:16S rRNA (guanine(966)-N(2))-methyltransferase RsmD [Marinimicrobium agarilyticum]
MKAAKRSVKNSAPSDTRPLRIIGGRWRGRKLSFPAVEGLRPTGDRIRETLFNWLAPYLPDSRCLDLFAGSGALGLEALSRGAAEVVLLERDPGAARGLKQNLATLDSADGRVTEGDSLKWLANEPATAFDMVFIDPPFQQQLWQASIDQLAAGDWLANEAAVYIESEPNTSFKVPAHWHLHRDKTSGQVRYRLYFLER